MCYAGPPVPMDKVLEMVRHLAPESEPAPQPAGAHAPEPVPQHAGIDRPPLPSERP